MKKSIWSTLVIAAFAAPAFAVNNEGTSGTYVVGSGAVEFNDNARHAKDGFGGQITVGIPLQWEHGSLELSYTDIGRDRSLDGRKDYQTSLLVNYVHDFGAFGLFKPFISGGLGGVQEDVLGEKHTHIGLDAGVGTLVKLPWYGLAVRTEAHALAQDNEKRSAPADKDFLVDYRVLLGLQVPLMWTGSAVAEVPTPIEACSVSVVDPATGRSGCAADSDHDGVPDGTDQCPGTEPGTVVNETGCPAVTAPVAVAPEAAPVPAPEAAPAPAAEPAATPVPVNQLQAVYFADNVSTIDDASKAKLDQAAAYLAADASARIEIEGHADSRGSEAYNIVLSSQRAEAARQYLVGKGVAPGRLSTIAYGAFKPVASNKTAEGRSQNRSVQFRIAK